MSISFREMFVELSENMTAEYDRLLSHIPQSQQRGEAREGVLREFLMQYLPERFGVGTGFVFDPSGNVSNQVDVIIYDREFAPKIALGGKSIYPVECVVGAGEIKSDIDSTGTLKNAIGNIRSVKSLRRAGRSRIGGGYLGNELDQLANPFAQICGFVFGSKLMSSESMLQILLEDCILNLGSRHLWVDLIGSLHSGVYYYWKTGDNGGPSDAHPMDALGIYHKQPEVAEASLLSFFMILHAALSGKSVGVPNMAEYLREGSAPSSMFKYLEFGIGQEKISKSSPA